MVTKSLMDTVALLALKHRGNLKDTTSNKKPKDLRDEKKKKEQKQVLQPSYIMISSLYRIENVS